MLQTIENALKELELPVYYGAASGVDNAALWNYIVFSNPRTTRSETNKGFTDYYSVGIVHENWVPRELESAVLEKMEQIPGMRLASNNVERDYTVKPGTNYVVEVAIMLFAKPRKRV